MDAKLLRLTLSLVMSAIVASRSTPAIAQDDAGAAESSAGETPVGSSDSAEQLAEPIQEDPSLQGLRDRQARAQRAYEEGVAALEADDSDAALASFRRALDVLGRVDIALALGATLQERGSLADAIVVYDRLLSEEFGPLTSAIANAVQRAKESAQADQATLSISSEAPVTVELNGERMGDASPQAPLVLRVDPGEYRLRSLAGDRFSYPLLIHVRTGENRELTLDPPEQREGSTTEGPPTVTPRRASAGPLVFISGSILALGAGVGTGIAFRGRVDDARDAVSFRESRPITEQARRLGIAATASYAAAGVLAAIGVIWLITDRRRVRASVEVGVGQVSVSGQF